MINPYASIATNKSAGTESFLVNSKFGMKTKFECNQRRKWTLVCKFQMITVHHLCNVMWTFNV
ncbi:Hypothetical protein LEPBI_I0123 [Leptospira biflexa serovar Patoc strain 'Patoc 1 (Paris)']|uniref:Uncharacterized protein n=1 Tax=Leptospira biflexa serovar Patoc (strain Patoc 1 / ATCC 23582 / Paris) TaxID=456481 RepID=B0SJW2_LEPBP|nr:Hypothetical protein LEPBI_I0123 [Leptospira biflexa serovar Patoc strain 'Patoc 1 (Paris)']